MEDAVYMYADAVVAAESRQDRAAGMQSDVSRHHASGSLTGTEQILTIA